MISNNIKRIKNILNGKYEDGTKSIVGYTKKQEEHKEGDIWFENEKYWTIKNGIRQNITKLDDIRNSINLPYVCPHCGKSMKTRLDKKFWQLKGRCFNCIVEEDTLKIINGTFIEYSKQEISKNVISYKKDLVDQIQTYIDSIGSKHFITERGDIEEWVGEFDKEKSQQIMNEKLEKFDEIINEKLK